MFKVDTCTSETSLCDVCTQKTSYCVGNWKTSQPTVWGKIEHPRQKWRSWGWCGRNEKARLPCPEIIIPKPRSIVVRTVQHNDLKPNSDVCYLARSQQLASPNLNIPHLFFFFEVERLWNWGVSNLHGGVVTAKSLISGSLSVSNCSDCSNMSTLWLRNSRTRWALCNISKHVILTCDRGLILSGKSNLTTQTNAW